MFKLEAGKKYVCRDGEVVTLGKCNSPHVVWNPAHRVYYFNDVLRNIHRSYEWKEDPSDIVAEYVEKKEEKPRKASSPFKKLLTAKAGDLFILKGEKFKVGIMENFPMLGQEGIYLTSKDRKNDDAYEYIHVRNKKGFAGMERQEMFDLLKSGKYNIS